MTSTSTKSASEDSGSGAAGRIGKVAGLGLILAFLVGLGCATDTMLPQPTNNDAAPYEAGKIQIGDIVRVTFPGATNLSFAQQVRVDGAVNLGQKGDIKAVDKEPKQLEAELLKLYTDDLILKEVNVQVESAGFPVFVSGAVLRPGKVLVNRSVTLLEAVMEAGGYDANRANLRRVKVVRLEGGQQRAFVIDLRKSLDNPKTEPFHLRPSDIVVVPEKFFF